MTPLQQAVASIHLKNYMSLVIITAIWYDYVLVFSDEIEFIWNKPWTWISTLFVLARYFGLCSTVFYALWGSSFVPGPANMCVLILCLYPEHIVRQLHTFQQIIIGILGACCFWVFTCAADLVMILRLWTLYSRSRLVIATLFLFYAMEVISFFVFYVSTVAPNGHGSAAGTAQVLGRSFCVWKRFSTTWSIALYVFKITFSTSICLLIAIKSGKELFRAYRATKRFRLDRYRKLLACEGTIYFTAILGFSILDLLSFAGIHPTGEWKTVLAVVLQLQIPPIALIPRFILTLRKLYLRDAQGRRTSDIDTAFGLTRSGSGRSSTAMSTIVFGGAQGQNEHGDEIQMEGMSGQIHTTNIQV